jgi:hypothetical protein
MPSASRAYEVAAAAEDLARAGPVDDAAAGHVAGPEDEVGAGVDAVQQVGELLRRVRPVGVHLDEDVVPVLHAPGEPVQVRGAEAGLAGAVEDVHVVVRGGELVGEVAGAVGAVVVGDQDVRAGTALRTRRRCGQVLALVVRRDDHEHPPGRRALAARRCRPCSSCPFVRRVAGAGAAAPRADRSSPRSARRARRRPGPLGASPTRVATVSRCAAGRRPRAPPGRNALTTHHRTVRLDHGADPTVRCGRRIGRSRRPQPGHRQLLDALVV